MKLYKPIFHLTLIASIQGCSVAQYIPWGLAGSAGNLFSGPEHSSCVASNAKVGDKVQLSSGGSGTIKSLSGESIRCMNPDYPIRAVSVSANDKSAPKAPAPHPSKLGLALPAGWEQRPPTEQMTTDGELQYATNRTIDANASLSATKREGITDLMVFATSRRANQVNRLVDPHQSEISQIEVNGKKAFRFDVTGELKAGQKFTYMTTVIEGETEIAILNTWTTAVNFEQQKESMGALAGSVTGL